MAIDAQTIQDEWNHLCSLARQRWTQLTEDDLRVQAGNIEQLVDRIQQKTGEGREAIEKFLSDVTARGSSAFRQAGDQVRGRYDRAGDLVRHHPTETVVAVFGIGLVAGLVIGLAIRPR